MTKATSSSERYQTARGALEAWDDDSNPDWIANGNRCIDALRALIDPAHVNRTIERITRSGS